jgi:hypothetical protein
MFRRLIHTLIAAAVALGIAAGALRNEGAGVPVTADTMVGDIEVIKDSD